MKNITLTWILISVVFLTILLSGFLSVKKIKYLEQIQTITIDKPFKQMHCQLWQQCTYFKYSNASLIQIYFEKKAYENLHFAGNECRLFILQYFRFHRRQLAPAKSTRLWYVIKKLPILHLSEPTIEWCFIWIKHN